MPTWLIVIIVILVIAFLGERSGQDEPEVDTQPAEEAARQAEAQTDETIARCYVEAPDKSVCADMEKIRQGRGRE